MPSGAQVSPVGDWDFTVGGAARGIARVTFNADGTIDGEIHVQTLKKAPGSGVDPRGQTELGRDFEPPPVAPPFTNIFGSANIDGRWGFDAGGHVLGFLNEGSILISESTTNASTNSVSFRGVVRGGGSPRMTLYGTSPLGSQIFR